MKPIIFINSFVDPLLPKESSDFDNIGNNWFSILANWYYGRHMGYYDSILYLVFMFLKKYIAIYISI